MTFLPPPSGGVPRRTDVEVRGQLWESVLSSHCVDPGDPTQATGLVSSPCSPGAICCNVPYCARSFCENLAFYLGAEARPRVSMGVFEKHQIGTTSHQLRPTHHCYGTMKCVYNLNGILAKFSFVS